MNAPLAQLVLSRVTEAARHSARLRHALRCVNRRHAPRTAGCAPYWAKARERRFWSPAGGKMFLVKSRWTIGPRGVLP